MTHLDELRRLRRARSRMDREYAEPLDVPSLAAAAYMSTAHFSRRFRAASGETPHAYLMTRRIERAQALFRSTGLSVTEVCMAVRATSLGSPSSLFTELVGMTPTQDRAADHDPLAGCGAATRWSSHAPSRPRWRDRSEQDRRSATTPCGPRVTAMTIQISGVHVLADDIDAAFSGGVLGFTVRNTVENGGFRWVTLASDDHPDLELVLSEPHGGRSQEDGDAIAALLAKGALSMLQLRVSDLDATFDRIAASAA